MIGPVMIGPSSSHTAGVVRIGRVARKLHTEIPEKAEITFYNSFARTYEGHGSDRAILAGLQDMKTDDERIRNAMEIAEQSGLYYVLKAVPNASALHPNSIRIMMTTGENKTEVLGISRGGGLISIVEVDGFQCNFTAQNHTLVIEAEDRKGSIAFITSVLSHDECNIATMTVDRTARNQEALLALEMDSGMKPVTLEYLSQLSWIDKVLYLPDIDL